MSFQNFSILYDGPPCKFRMLFEFDMPVKFIAYELKSLNLPQKISIFLAVEELQSYREAVVASFQYISMLQPHGFGLLVRKSKLMQQSGEHF